MQTAFTQKFKKQVDSCQDKRIRKKVLSVIQKVTTCQNLSSLKSVKKLKGAKNCFRIRIGEYRIGIMLEQDKVIFAAFDHRGDIYKYFP